MEWQQMLDTLARLPPDTRNAWLQVASGLAALMLLLLWLESRYFARSKRTGSWAAVRLASLVAGPVAVLLLFLPARAVSGMEALAVFYLSMLTVTPLVWFGAHLWAGRSVHPALSRDESLALAVSGLLILAIPGIAFLQAQRPLQDAARAIGEQRTLPADNPPLEHRIQPVAAYTFPGVGLVFAQSLIGAPDTRLVRIEQRMGGQWPSTPDSAHPQYCTMGNDVHLLWSAQERPPYLRIHWAQSNGAVVRSEFTPDMSQSGKLPPVPFSADLRPDGLDPVVPIARTRMYLVLHKDGEEPDRRILSNGLEEGEKRSTDCVSKGFTVWRVRAGWELQSAVVQFQPPVSAAPLRAVLERPSR
ncbi:MAG: hypothetical protein KA164_01745 [Rhodoferax sp.]|nr:hypothetical protein [Rhodoferax sp.]